ncbi:hypothetical protein KIN20_020016 [Parelaphostrongylus tenuis]|uniref:WAP domain-containing protein n=1 Tax=Parelaphostrongylus tenuis TaxID=148309 RepID=A0AAD5N3N5_PARTN|nr:hypothetical protein KIN20_020016 [Parelaphostrongylus tenuis]
MPKVTSGFLGHGRFSLQTNRFSAAPSSDEDLETLEHDNVKCLKDRRSSLQWWHIEQYCPSQAFVKKCDHRSDCPPTVLCCLTCNGLLMQYSG